MDKDVSLDDIEAAHRFLEELQEYEVDYKKHLQKQYKRSTVSNHMVIVGNWCEFICLYETVTGFEKIMPGMLGSKFYQNIRYDHDTTPVFAKNAVTRFLKFIYQEYGVGNVDLLEKLNKKR